MPALTTRRPTAMLQPGVLKEALAKANTIPEVRGISDQIRLVKEAMEAAGYVHEAVVDVAEVWIAADRKLGAMLKQTVLNRGGGDRRSNHPLQGANGDRPTLKALGVEPTKSHRTQRLADVPEVKVAQFLRECRGDEALDPTPGACLRFAAGVHVSQNTGDNEWYTPEPYIAAARAVMGGIDLDPASNPEANEVVQAKRIYTTKDDSLRKNWKGRVWMNPPYGQPLIVEFCEKLVESFTSGQVPQACVLVNNATETNWFQGLASSASALCFPRGRVKYWSREKIGTPLQGQAVLYLGRQAVRFLSEFSAFGFMVLPQGPAPQGTR